VDGADWGEVFGFEVANSFEVLEADALVVLSSAGEDFAVGGFDGGEGRVGPFGRLGGDGVDVGVEERAFPADPSECIFLSK
jgi:hypothetical protein